MVWARGFDARILPNTASRLGAARLDFSAVTMRAALPTSSSVSSGR
jgi:hypothetical protein